MLSPLEIDLETARLLWARFKKISHWIDWGFEQFTAKLIDPQVAWFSVRARGRQRIGGLIWVADLDPQDRSAYIGIALWDHFEKRPELVSVLAELFNVDTFYALIKHDNKFSKLFSETIGFQKLEVEEEGCEKWRWSRSGKD